MSDTAKLTVAGETYELPVVTGTENEKAVDIAKLRSATGHITFDDGYGNTGSCLSEITFIDGEKGILRYRGIDIEEIAEKSDFVEIAHMLIWGRFPTNEERARFDASLVDFERLPEGLKQQISAFPKDAHPMAMTASLINSMSCYHQDLYEIEGNAEIEHAIQILLGKMLSMVAYSYRHKVGKPFVEPKESHTYCESFLHLLFAEEGEDYTPDPEVAAALDLLFVLHADHEQNCSTSTVRMVGSSMANLFTSVSAGVSALWGKRHGGANQAVLEMLERIRKSGDTVDTVVAKCKDKDSDFRLMGFGHRVYKNFDPRAKIIKKACDRVLEKLGVEDPLLDIAKQLEAAALKDDYFVERKLYPNVDFYSGIIMRAIGIPADMFTVLFAIGRMPGWIANWKETRDNPKGRIYRPRQVYVGAAHRSYEDAKKAQ